MIGESMHDTGSSLDQPNDPTPIVAAPTESRLSKPRLIILTIIVALFIIASVTVILFKKPAQKAPAPITINTQSLDNGTLNKLTTQAGSDQTKQQLTITPDTLFKNGLQVQKDLGVGGNLNVSGTTTLQGGVGINGNLAVHGALSVGGAFSAASISVGSLAISTINVSGSLNFGGHLVPSGATPDAIASNGASGGTVSVSGNDTAGTVTINMGNGTLVAGEFAIITFRTPFATTPKVQLTPINSTASSLNYYATRSTTFFTINSSSLPTNGASYVFDYLVTQ